MKRNMLVLFFLLFYSYTAFAEPSAIDVLSIWNDFNTLVDSYYNRTTYYFYGFDEYSNAIIWQDYDGFWTLQMSTYRDRDKFITFGNGYPLNTNYTIYYDDYEENGKIKVSAFMGASSDQGYEYSTKAGKLVYWATSHDLSPQNIAQKIHETDEQIEIDTGKNTYVYSNVEKEKLFDFYISIYLRNIDYIFGGYDDKASPVMRKEYSINNMWYLLENIDELTGRELAIFRNYIFARHNYRFQSSEWNSFFKKHYKSDYNGTKSNNEVMELLTDYEKMVLSLIIESE
jgi:hypothetical protein